MDGKPYCLSHHKEQKGYSYGLDHELQQKQKQKWDPSLASAVQSWVEACTGRKWPVSDMQAALKSGIILCELINSIWPKTIAKINAGVREKAHSSA